MLYALKLKFVRSKDTGFPLMPGAAVCVEPIKPGKDEEISITDFCTCSEEFDTAIEGLKKELDKIKKQAAKKFKE